MTRIPKSELQALKRSVPLADLIGERVSPTLLASAPSTMTARLRSSSRRRKACGTVWAHATPAAAPSIG
jgi:hypothetical protein